MLRPRNAGSNMASEHIGVTRLALAQLPRRLRRQVLIRTDSGGHRAPPGARAETPQARLAEAPARR